jgi:peptidyl-Lys metalloendopeptidase
MLRLVRWTISAMALVSAGGVFAAPLDKLDVQLTLPDSVVQGDADVAVDVAITNTTGHAVRVLKWQLPSDDLQGPLFRVLKQDGTAASYVGPLVKRAAPRESDYVHIEAGAALNYRVALSKDYELGNGRHTVEYISRGRVGDEAAIESASPTVLWTQGRTVKTQAPRLPEWLQPEAASITYTGNCTSSEKTQLSDAVGAATDYSTEASNYLSRTPSGTRRYVEWFGNFKSTRWNTVEGNFNEIESAFKTKPLTLDCSCSSGAYAYVYSNEPYKIYLCNAFWNAPLRGTDSKGGTLVHEMSHFNVVAGTSDWAYGQSAARNLANSNPKRAIDNADSHEYFAENNPSLP